MELSEAMRTSPAVREFTDEPVADDVLHEIIDDARFAPNGGNRQGWRVIVVKDPAIRRELGALYQLGWREYRAHVRKGVVPFAANRAGALSAQELADARQTPAPSEISEHLETAPAVLVVTADLGALATTDIDLERHSIVGGASIYPFVHNLLLAARARRLGGVMTTVLCREESAAQAILGIPPDIAIASMVVLGHPVKTITRLRRQPVEAFTTIDRWDGPSLRHT
jgi:nitroreductase